MVDSKESYKFDVGVKGLTQDEITRIRKRKRGGNMQLHVSVMFT